MHEVILLIILPLGTAFFLGLIKFFLNREVSFLVYISGALHLLLAVKVIYKVVEEPFSYNLGNWDPILGIHLVIDFPAAFLTLLVSILAYLVIIYSSKLIKQDKSKYYGLLLILIAGLQGMIMTVDLFNMYVFFEIVSITSYALVVVNKKEKCIEGSFKYLIIGAVGGVFVLLGIILTYQATGSLNLAEAAGEFGTISPGLQQTILVFFLVGFGVKAALIPLHAWLPDVYSQALVSFSVLSSGLIIKVSLYSLLKIIYNLFGVEEVVSSFRPVLTWWGGITFLLAHLLAYQQDNLRRMLGYSSIAQMGYIMLAFGLGTEAGIIGGNYHLLNHALMKGTLFLAAGIFTFSANAYRIIEIKGLGRRLPWTSFFFTTASFAIVGLPPFNGFISKWLIVQAALEVEYMVIGFMVLVGTVLAAGYYLKVIKVLYSKEDNGEVKLPTWQLRIPTLMLGTLCLILGVFPQPIFILLKKTTILLTNNYLNVLIGG